MNFCMKYFLRRVTIEGMTARIEMIAKKNMTRKKFEKNVEKKKLLTKLGEGKIDEKIKQ